MTTIKFINNSVDNNIYDTTIQIIKNNKTMFVDVMFDRAHNCSLGMDSTQFEKDIKDMLEFISNEPINFI